MKIKKNHTTFRQMSHLARRLNRPQSEWKRKSNDTFTTAGRYEKAEQKKKA